MKNVEAVSMQTILLPGLNKNIIPFIMYYNILFYFTIIASLLTITFISIKNTNQLEYYDNKTHDKVINCTGCLDEELKCHPGTNPVCSNQSQTLCYSFYDENSNLRTPCGLYDSFGNVEESCKNCSQYCEYCIGPDKKGRCIGRELFNCKLCPYSRICYENVFNICIPKN